jgi:predicted phosphoadenosine phosphosulfate sulfurtransferase
LRIWKEKLDPNRHKDHTYPLRGGTAAKLPKDPTIESYVYFVNVCSFTFEFVSLDDIREYLSYFSKKPIPSSGKSGGSTLEPYWRAWHERIPMWLKEEPKRQKVVKALTKALKEFEK